MFLFIEIADGLTTRRFVRSYRHLPKPRSTDRVNFMRSSDQCVLVPYEAHSDHLLSFLHGSMGPCKKGGHVTSHFVGVTSLVV